VAGVFATALDSLAALGLLIGYDDGGARRWKAPERSAA
jgi:hypothetical protein